MAVCNSDPQVLNLILNNIRFDNIRGEDGWTMLHNAVAFGPKETIKFLLESRQQFGFNLEERTNSGSTVLHLACRQLNIEIVDLVFKALEEVNTDINFDTEDFYQRSPLHFACRNSKSDVAIRLLQRFPEKINILSNYGYHILHFASRFGHLELMKYILEDADFNVNFKVFDHGGRIPLDLACKYGQVNVVKFFLRNYARLGICCSFYNRARKLAKQHGHMEIVNLLRPWNLFKSMMTSMFKIIR